MDEARERFARGLQLFDERNFEAARVELERAYELAPTWKLLYNIGICYSQRGDYVEAIKDLERYLKEGGADVAKDRQDDVNKELTNLRPRIAHVTIKVSIPGADVQVDDQTVAKSPLSEPLMVNPGRRKITAVKQGYFPSNQVVTAAGSDSLTVNIDLKPLPKVSNAKNPYVGPALIFWSVAGAAAVGGGVTAFFANQAANELQTKRGQLNVTGSDLQKTQTQEKNLALGADITFGVALVAAGVASYFTIKLAGWKPSDADEKEHTPPPDKLQLGLTVLPNGASLFGSF